MLSLAHTSLQGAGMGSKCPGPQNQTTVSHTDACIHTPLHMHTYPTSHAYIPHFTCIRTPLHMHTYPTSHAYIPYFTCIRTPLHMHTYPTSHAYVPHFTCIRTLLHMHTYPTSHAYVPHFTCIHTLLQSSLFSKAQYHKLQICLRGLYNLYTYDIPDLWPPIGSGKTPKK